MNEQHTMPMRRTQPARERIAGMTLIELMVALAIGAFLMIGAVTVFMQGRTTFRVNESLSRMQENGRFALDTLEPDIRMAHYWGLTTRTAKVLGRAATTLDPAAPPGMGPPACGKNWTVDLDRAIDGTNNSYAWPTTLTTCAAGAGTAQAGSDTLVIRRVSEDPVVPAANNMYLQSARYEDSQLFIGATIPTGFLPPPASQTHRLMASGYYVSTGSNEDAAIPSLRRKTLVGVAIQDQELLAGIEDLQVQFGVDTDAAGTAERGSVDEYVNPGDAILATAEILAVRIWLRVRAERRENGFTDTTNYVYADQDFTPTGDDAQFRRILVSKTIYIRNARPAL